MDGKVGVGIFLQENEWNGNFMGRLGSGRGNLAKTRMGVWFFFRSGNVKLAHSPNTPPHINP